MLAALLLVACTALLTVGCEAPPRAGVAEGPVPDYRELAERYNANLRGLDQLWSSTVVAMRWVDEEGRRHFEQGEGNFIFVQPDRVALTVGKLGDVMLWAGADERRYWLLDLRDDGVAYVGEHAYAGRPCSEPLPLPVYPRTVPYLLGLLPLDPDAASVAPPVEAVLGGYLIEPPGLNVRMLLDPETALPIRVDLTDAEGRSVVISRLSRYEPMEVQGLPPGGLPRIATRAELTAVGQEAQLSLSLSNLSDGRRFDKINPRAFDLDALLQAYKPAEVVDLDRGCK